MEPITAGGPSPSDSLRQMLHGYQVSQALYVAAKLDIADLLTDGARSAEALAEHVGVHGPTLHRLLRLLASLGVFAEDDDGRFGLTPLAECLRSDAPGSQRDWAIMVCGPTFWASWGELLHSIRTGVTAFPKVHGMSNWEYRKHHPAEQAIFDAAMTANTVLAAEAVAGGYDFSDLSVLADVGGGHGLLLATILAAHPSMRGLLFDQPQVVNDASNLPVCAGVIDRCDLVGGDFFESVPRGADAYLLKSVTHDWDDDKVIAILRACRSAMGGAAKLLLVERILRPGEHARPHEVW